MENIYVQDAKKLIGLKLTGVLPLGEKMKKALMWEDRDADSAMALVFEGGVMVVPMKDDEGNGAGVLMYLDVLEYARLTAFGANATYA